MSCDKIRSGFVLNCDETCIHRQNELKHIAEEQERTKREQEEKKTRLELEEFEKKFGKKKYKERKIKVIEEKSNSQLYIWAGLGLAISVLCTFMYFLLLK